MAVSLALKTSLPALRGHHILVRSDNIIVGLVCSDLMGTVQITLTEGRSLTEQSVLGRAEVDLFNLRGQHSLPNLFLEGARCPGPSPGHQMGQGSLALGPPGGPTELIQLLSAAPSPIPF